MVGIAQLVRASVCGTEGRGFEPHYLPKKVCFKLMNIFIFMKIKKTVNRLVRVGGGIFYLKTL